MGRAPAFRAGADGEEKRLVCLAGGRVPVQEGSFSSLGSLLAHKHTWECVCVCGVTPFLLEVLGPAVDSGCCLPS